LLKFNLKALVVLNHKEVTTNWGLKGENQCDWSFFFLKTEESFECGAEIFLKSI